MFWNFVLGVYFVLFFVGAFSIFSDTLFWDDFKKRPLLVSCFLPFVLISAPFFLPYYWYKCFKNRNAQKKFDETVKDLMEMNKLKQL